MCRNVECYLYHFLQRKFQKSYLDFPDRWNIRKRWLDAVPDFVDDHIGKLASERVIPSQQFVPNRAEN